MQSCNHQIDGRSFKEVSQKKTRTRKKEGKEKKDKPRPVATRKLARKCLETVEVVGEPLKKKEKFN